MIECDVLVVGCGPAGASAARAAAIRGAKVICIDKKKEIGVPVQCAEGIGSYLFPYLPFEIPKNQLKWRIDGIKFWVDGIEITKTGGFWEGYTIERKSFDVWLAKTAANTGAKILTDTEFLRFKPGDERIAICTRKNEELLIKAKCVIGADSSDSKILKEMGGYKPKHGDLADVYSWEMTNLNLESPHLEQIFIGDFAPGGYGYIFPKSKKTANLGVGISFAKKEPKKYFEDFVSLDLVRNQLKGAKFVAEKSKKVIWGDITDRWIYRDVLLAGDAANHNLKPFIEGILPAIISGNLAGELAHSVCEGELIEMEDYFKKLEKQLHPHFSVSKEIMKTAQRIFSLSDKKKNLLFAGLASQLFELERMSELEECSYEMLKAMLLKEKEKELLRESH